MQEAILSAIVGISGALIGGYATYKAVDKQIKEETRVREKESREHTVLTAKIIIQFLWNEIEHNMNILEYPDKFIWSSIESSEEPFQHGYGSEKTLIFEEFNEVKLELLKYDKPLIKDVLDIYFIFSIFMRYHDINQFSLDEYNQIKQLPNMYLKVRNALQQGKALFG